MILRHALREARIKSRRQQSEEKDAEVVETEDGAVGTYVKEGEGSATKTSADTGNVGENEWATAEFLKKLFIT